jgi:hypothetical protein
MRLVIVFIWMILGSCSLRAQTAFSFPTFDQTPLREVIHYLESTHNLVFSYRDLSANNCFVRIESGTYELDEYLKLLTAQCNLEFERINDKYLLLIPKASADNQRICGLLLDQENDLALAYANILVKGKGIGTSTNKQGRFELNGVQVGDTLRMSYVGYPTTQIVVKEIPASGCPIFYFKPEGAEIEPVIVTVYLMDGVLQDAQGQKITIKPDKLSVFPGTIEPDIFTAVQMLPGVWSANETASGINLRGGTPDQNLILYDGIPIYHTGHFFGMISAFNPYNIEEVNVYRSGIGSEYGGRVSGVIDIRGKTERPEHFKIDLGLNLTHGHLNTQIPLWKKSSLSLSVRRSFTDFWQTPTFRSFSDKVFQGSKLDEEQAINSINEPEQSFYFTDFNLKWNWQTGKNKFGIDMFTGLNRLDYRSDLPNFQARSTDVVQLDNTGFGIFWSRDWSNNFASQIRLTNASFTYDYTLSAAFNLNLNQSIFESNIVNDIQDIGLNWINTWTPEPNHKLKFGIQTTDVQIDFNTGERLLDSSRMENQFFEHRLATLFAEYHLSLEEVLELDMGVRYQYSPVIDNYYFEPRVALTAKINPFVKLKLSSSKQFQFVSQLVIFDLENIGFANEIWIASEGKIIPVIESNQWAGGIQYSKNNWKIDLEGYIKELAGITSLSSSFAVSEQQPYGQGDSRIRGIDILVQREVSSKYRNWLSYTLSQSIYEFPTLGTNLFPASHDQRHTLQWVHLLNYKPWEFAFGWRFGSGLPYSQFVDTEFVNPPNGSQPQPAIIYEELNGKRLIPYHRLDASVMYHFGKKDGFAGHLGLSLVNLYNRENILGRKFVVEDFDLDEERIDVLTINQSGLGFTPNLVFRMYW